MLARLFSLFVACFLAVSLGSCSGVDSEGGDGDGDTDSDGDSDGDISQLAGNWFGFWWMAGDHPAIVQFNFSSAGSWTGSVTMMSLAGSSGYPTFGSVSFSEGRYRIIDDISPDTFIGQASPRGNILFGHDSRRHDWIVVREGISLSESEPCNGFQYEACAEYRGFFCDHGYCNICQPDSCQDICNSQGRLFCGADCNYDPTLHCPSSRPVIPDPDEDENCSNGFDDDGDGDIDCGDSDCVDDPVCTSCPGGFTECDGACVNLEVDPENCGGCGNTCARGEMCIRGVCSSGIPFEDNCDDGIDNDGDGYIDCDDDDCEDDPVCTSCPAGLVECDGACVNLDIDPENCGECGNACARGEICDEGVCVPLVSEDCSNGVDDDDDGDIDCGDSDCVDDPVCTSCPGGFTECDGACVNLDIDPENCGSCGHACDRDEVCDEGICVPFVSEDCSNGMDDDGDGNIDCADSDCAEDPVCIPCGGGFTNCGGICVDLDADPENCGRCGNACARGEICDEGVCSSGVPSEDDCDDGRDNDGDGNVDCDDSDCEDDPICDSCAGGTTACGGVCVNLDVDPENCGECGHTCDRDEVCDEGICVPFVSEDCSNGVDDDGDGWVDCADRDCDEDPVCFPCAEGFTNCDGSCVNLNTDPENCGECGVRCEADDVCLGGECVPSVFCGDDICSPEETCEACPSDCCPCECSLPRDQDGDGWLKLECCGFDCDDTDPRVHPGSEDPRGDGIDWNCDGID